MKAWSGGDEAARGRLAERVYPELRRMARRYMKNERQGNTLQTTDLVHEAYLRLVDVTQVEWRQRAQFFAMAAQIMRRILVDAARARGADKRGGSAAKVNLDETALLSSAPDDPFWPWMRPLQRSRRLPLARPRWSNCVTSAD